MLEIEEVERRILSELQEAGEENVPTILNTITERTGNFREVTQVQQALEKLVRSDLVRAATRPSAAEKLAPLSAEDSLVLIADFQSRLRFRESDSRWTCVADPWPEIVATDAGLRKADEILEQQGYQWWRAKG